LGDIWFSLTPGTNRDLTELIHAAKPLLADLIEPVGIWLSSDSHGDAGKPINLLVSGQGASMDMALAELNRILANIPGIHSIKLNKIPGQSELKLRLNGEAIQRAGLQPETVARNLQLLADGEIIASFAEQGEPVSVRVRAYQADNNDITALLRNTVSRRDGTPVPLAQIVSAEQATGPATINHIDFKRVISLQAELDKNRLDTLAANQLIRERWEQIHVNYPDVQVDFAGEMEAVNEGLNQLLQKFLLGLGLIFLIVGAQFRSYGMPFLVLLKIPMAFSGVVLGLLISREPVSLYTLYGAVALAGIAVNSAILLFAAAQDRLDAGLSVMHATVSAARRRMLPILITSLTTLVGLLPLAVGGDASATMWRPVATAIVWGVGFSTVMTLFIVPLLFSLGMGWKTKGVGQR
jgi:multidrug efflux pump subunit AcrB